MGLGSDFYRKRAGRTNFRTHNIKQDLSHRNGRRILLVDNSIWFHSFTASIDVAREYHTMPPIPVHSFLRFFSDRHTALMEHGVDPFYVFDGTRNPLKGHEDARRHQREQEAINTLALLYQRRDPSEFDLVEKARVKATFIRNDMIALVVEYLRKNNIRYIQAPFEADPQLVSLLQQGFGDCILTEDSDVFALGADRWMTKLNLKSGCCNIFERRPLLQVPALGQGTWDNHLGAFAVFSGCDFIHKLDHLDIDRAMTNYVTAPNKLLYLQNLELCNSWPPSVRTTATIGAPGFASLAQQVIAYFNYAPVWHLVSANESDPIDTHNHSTFKVELHPLNSPDVPFISEDAWGSAIGFGQAPSTLLPVQPDQFDLLAHLSVWGRDGKEPTPLPFPRYTDPQSGISFFVAHGAIMDCTTVCLEHQPDLALERFIWSRGLKLPRNATRQRKLDIVRRIWHAQRQPSPYSLDDIRNSVKHKGWQAISEILRPRSGETGFTWKGPAEAMQQLRSLTIVDDNYINVVYGKGRNGIRNRALERLRGGQYHPRSLQMAMVEERSSGQHCFLFRCLCTPSRNSDDYLVHVCFDSHGEFMTTPVSRCECPSGQYLDTHILGALLIISLVQHHTDWTSEGKLCEALPIPIKTLRNVPVPWSLTFGDDVVNKEARKAAQIQVSAGSNGCNTDDDVDTLNNEKDEFHVLFTNDDDERTPSVPVCQEAQRMIAESRKRAEVLNSEKEYEYQLSLEQIRKANKAQLDNVGGPNESIESKLEQVNLLLDVEEAAEQGDIPKSLLTHYTHNMKHALQRWKIQLEKCLELGLTKTDIQWPEQRLCKAPIGTRILADKGFDECASKYGNVNENLTPTRLSSRGQFSTDEMLRDTPVKKRRWGSEANFRRISEVSCVQDRVPRHLFPQLHHAVDYAHGRQNAIGLPFYYPRDHYYPCCGGENKFDGSDSDEDYEYEEEDEEEEDDDDIELYNMEKD